MKTCRNGGREEWRNGGREGGSTSTNTNERERERERVVVVVMGERKKEKKRKERGREKRNRKGRNTTGGLFPRSSVGVEDHLRVLEVHCRGAPYREIGR